MPAQTAHLRSEKQGEPWRSRWRRVAEPCDDSDDNDSRKPLPCGMRCGTTKIVRRIRTTLPDRSIDGSISSLAYPQSKPKPNDDADNNDCKILRRPGNKIGTRNIVRRKRTPLPGCGADGSAPLLTPSQSTSEPDHDSDDTYSRKQQRPGNRIGITKVVRRRRSAIPDISTHESTLSPTLTQPKPEPAWVDLRDISAHCASAQTLVEACQVLARSIPAPKARKVETETLGSPVSDEYSTYVAGFAQHSLTSQLQISSQQRRKHTKRSSLFLDLPAEIRNLVYEHLIPASRIHIISTRPNKELRALNKDWTTALFNNKRPRRRLCHLPNISQLGEEHRIELNILLVCRQVKSEAEFFLYSRPTFRFNSCRTITRFLDRASKRGISAIENISLCDQGYGDTRWSEHIIWQLRYYQQWDRTCAQVGQSFPGLKHLKLEANLAIWPLKYSHDFVDMSWKESVLLLTPQKIDKVEVKLRHRREDNQSLIAEWQNKLENKMMTEAGQRRRDEERSRDVLLRLAEEKKVTALEFKGFVIRWITQQDVLSSQHGLNGLNELKDILGSKP